MACHIPAYVIVNIVLKNKKLTMSILRSEVDIKNLIQVLFGFIPNSSTLAPDTFSLGKEKMKLSVSEQHAPQELSSREKHIVIKSQLKAM